nr:hypothetical protein [Endozoicomonas sp. YOMI1]
MNRSGSQTSSFPAAVGDFIVSLVVNNVLYKELLIHKVNNANQPDVVTGNIDDIGIFVITKTLCRFEDLL